MSLLGTVAHADYQCVDTEEKTHLTVLEDRGTRFADTTLELESEEGKKTLYGKILNEEGVFLSKKTIQIFPYLGNTLTIVSKPRTCGRGFCETGSELVIKAHLIYDESHKWFTCDKINL